MEKLSAAMQRAIETAHADGTLSGVRRDVEAALIRRGLAKAIYGTTTRRNRYSRTAQTVYNVYLGAQLIK